ncbi:MAG: acyl carrier protein [Oscillospiraceae bacterium]|nr:acyl carrier protein [Oscillospiraceae bacterium]
MIDKIKEILSEYSGIGTNEMNEETKLVSDLGLSSLDVVNVVVAFEDEFGIEIPDSDIKYLNTINDIKIYIEKSVQEYKGYS